MLVFILRLELASLSAQKSGESPDNPDYKSANVILDGNTVVSAVPQVSAVAYHLNGTREIRLYYIAGTSSNLHLAELAKTGDGNWREGALTKNRITITADSLISANDEDGTGDVKVFYNTKNDSDVTVPAVAWVQLGAETWSSRIIGEWK